MRSFQVSSSVRAPDPQKVCDHTEEDGTCRSRQCGEQVMYAEFRQGVGHNPPNCSAPDACHMKLPKASPFWSPVTKYPPIVHKKSRQERCLCPNNSSRPKRHSHDFLEKV